jgi:RNA polymerase sigma-70 factor (ECF subfamily)
MFMEETPHSPKELVIAYSDELFRWALFKTGSKEVAEDLVQDTFYAAIKSSDSFQNKSKVKTWLYAILNNKITDYHRKNFKNNVINESRLLSGSDNENILGELFDENGSWYKENRLSHWEESEDTLLDNPNFSIILEDCMKDLPGIWHAALRMKYLEEKDGNDICKELEISPSNFWQILHRSKLRLKTCIVAKWKR